MGKTFSWNNYVMTSVAAGKKDYVTKTTVPTTIGCRHPPRATVSILRYITLHYATPPPPSCSPPLPSATPHRGAPPRCFTFHHSRSSPPSSQPPSRTRATYPTNLPNPTPRQYPSLPHPSLRHLRYPAPRQYPSLRCPTLRRGASPHGLSHAHPTPTCAMVAHLLPISWCIDTMVWSSSAVHFPFTMRGSR